MTTAKLSEWKQTCRPSHALPPLPPGPFPLQRCFCRPIRSAIGIETSPVECQTPHSQIRRRRQRTRGQVELVVERTMNRSNLGGSNPTIAGQREPID